MLYLVHPDGIYLLYHKFGAGVLQNSFLNGRQLGLHAGRDVYQEDG